MMQAVPTHTAVGFVLKTEELPSLYFFRVVWCVCVYIYVKLHITAQPGPEIQIFYCYQYGSTLWGWLKVCV